MNSPRVCYVASDAINNRLEGHNIGSIRIIEAAKKIGIPSRVVTLEERNAKPKPGFYPIPTHLRSNRKTSSFPSVWELLSSFHATLLAKKLNCDILHLLNVTKEIFLFNSKLLGLSDMCIPHFFHSSFPFQTFATFKLRSWLIKFRVFPHILSSNLSLLRFLVNEVGLSEDRVHLVPYPVDTDQFKPADKQKLRKKYSIPENAPLVVYVGAIDSDRGFFALVSAFKTVLKRIPRATLFIAYPPRSKQTEELLNRFVFNSAINDHVLLSGPNASINEVYAMADVVALPFQKPYWITAPPLVLLEAMSSASPIVTTPLDVIAEIGTNMEDMIFVKPGNLDSLANGIVYFLEDENEARKIGLRARENVLKNFSMQICGEKLEKTYSKIKAGNF